MKYLRLAFLSIVDQIKLNIIIVLQLIVVFITVNVLIGSINNRSMLSDPYKGILDKPGWYATYFSELSPEEKGDATLIGEPEVISINRLFPRIRGYDRSVSVIIVPDKVFSKLRLPVTGSVDNADYRLMVFANDSGIKAGDKLTLTFWENPAIENVVVTDILTDPAYCPSFTYWDIDGDISMLYRSISSDKDEGVYMITSVSGAEAIGLYKDEWGTDPEMIIYYPNGADESTVEAQQEFFDSHSGWHFMPLSTISERTQAKLKEDYYKYVPMCIITALIVIIGTAGAIAVQTLREMKNYAVYYLCGLKWRKTALVGLAKVVMLLLVSGGISGAALFILHSSSIAAGLGIVFNDINLYASLGLVGMIVISSLTMPLLLIRKTRPAELMRRIKND